MLLFYSIILISLSFNKHQIKLEIESFVNISISLGAFKWNDLFSFPHLIPNPTRSFDHNWDFPKAFWKESRRLLIAAVLSLTAGSEVARPFAVYHMESNSGLFMASPDDTTVQRDWKPSSIYQLYGRRSEQRRPKIIVNIYLKVVGLKERKAQHILDTSSNYQPLPLQREVSQGYFILI